MIPRRGLVSLALTFFGSALVVGFRTSDPTLLPLSGVSLGVASAEPAANSAPPPIQFSPPSNNPAGTTPAPAAQLSPTGPSAPPSPTAAVSGYRDGSYTGAAEQTPFEVIAVQVIIKNGQIIDIAPTTLSGSRGRSNQINNYAVPLLRSEVLAAQSAQINAVSGATWTSEGYAASLQSALDGAKA